MKETCEKCHWFDKFHDGAETGYCTVMPPAIGQPEVKRDGRCGKFRPSPPVWPDTSLERLEASSCKPNCICAADPDSWAVLPNENCPACVMSKEDKNDKS